MGLSLWRPILAGLAAAVVPLTAARAAINLELRPVVADVAIGEVLEVGLYAVSDDDAQQPIGGMDVILRWDPRVLELIEHVDDGPYDWSLSGFLDDSRLDGLNDTWSDGDALYQCLRRNAPQPPAFATPSGLLVTTFRFDTLRPATRTTLELPPAAGSFTVTRVLDGFDSSDVTGGVVPTDVGVLVCGLASDFDDDCDVDSADLAALQACLSGPDASVVGDPDCGPVDVDGDGDVDLTDAARLQMGYTGL